MNLVNLNISIAQIASAENLDEGVKTFVNIMEMIVDFFTESFIESLETHVGGAITQIAPLFLAGLSIYVMLIAMNWLRQGFDDNVGGTIKTITGWLLIIAFAFNTDNFIYISRIVYEFPDKVASVFSGTSIDSSTSVFTSVLTIGTDMDASLYEARKDSPWYHFKGITYTLMGGVIMFSTLAVFMLVMAYYLIAKISLLLTLMVGPAFIGFMLYSSTRQYGMNWIGQLLNYTVTVVLYVIATNMVATVSLKAFEQIRTFGDNAGWDTGAAVLAAIISLILGVLVFIVVLNIPSIATALTGGATLQNKPFEMATNMALRRLSFPKKSSGGSISKK